MLKSFKNSAIIMVIDLAITNFMQFKDFQII